MTASTGVEALRGMLAALDIPATFAQVVPGDARRIDGGPVPDRWYVTPTSIGTWTVGAFDRGSFAPYDTYDTIELAANAVRHLWAAPVEPVTLDAAAASQARDRAHGLEALVRSGGTVAGSDIPPGTAFDTYGTLANHTAFVWQTPVPARSNPPTDVGRPYLQLVVRQPLPGPIRSGVMAPAFEQPGGGVAISLPRCLRWYYDARILDVFRLTEGAPVTS